MQPIGPRRDSRPGSGALPRAAVPSPLSLLRISRVTLSDGRDPTVAAPDRLTRFALTLGRIIPDALTTSVVLLVLVFLVALLMGNSLWTTMDAYYRGLWMLLQFTMQMTLILVLSTTLGAAAPFRRMVIRLSRLPASTTQVL